MCLFAIGHHVPGLVCCQVTLLQDSSPGDNHLILDQCLQNRAWVLQVRHTRHKNHTHTSVTCETHHTNHTQTRVTWETGLSNHYCESFNFVGMKLRGLTTLDMFVTWICKFQLICNITKMNNYIVVILNSWIALPTKYMKLNVKQKLMISQCMVTFLSCLTSDSCEETVTWLQHFCWWNTKGCVIWPSL